MTETSLELHYRSQRPGLGPYVVGICEQVAQQFFDLQVSFKLLRGREDGSADHEVGAGTGLPPRLRGGHTHVMSCHVMWAGRGALLKAKVSAKA